MARKVKKMIIQKTVCDVPKMDGRLFFGRHICGEPAIAVGGLMITLNFGKEPFHLCVNHAEIPVNKLCELLQPGKDAGLVDDAQK